LHISLQNVNGQFASQTQNPPQQSHPPKGLQPQQVNRPPATVSSPSAATPSRRVIGSTSGAETPGADAAPWEISDTSGGAAALAMPDVNQTPMIETKTVVVPDSFIGQLPQSDLRNRSVTRPVPMPPYRCDKQGFVPCSAKDDRRADTFFFA